MIWPLPVAEAAGIETGVSDLPTLEIPGAQEITRGAEVTLKVTGSELETGKELSPAKLAANEHVPGE